MFQGRGPRGRAVYPDRARIVGVATVHQASRTSPLQLGPIDLDVEVHAEPAPVADIRRPEEPLGSGRNQGLLGTGRRSKPCCSPVVVMSIGRGHELPLPDEPARLAVAQPFGRVGEREAERPQALIRVAAQIARIRLFLASCVSSAFPSASSSGGRYIPNRPR